MPYRSRIFSPLFLTIELGILIGVGASLLWRVYTPTRPVIAVVGRLPGTRSYRDITHFEQTETFERILILHMDAPFFFGDLVFLKEPCSAISTKWSVPSL